MVLQVLHFAASWNYVRPCLAAQTNFLGAAVMELCPDLALRPTFDPTTSPDTAVHRRGTCRRRAAHRGGGGHAERCIAAGKATEAVHHIVHSRALRWANHELLRDGTVRSGELCQVLHLPTTASLRQAPVRSLQYPTDHTA